MAKIETRPVTGQGKPPPSEADRQAAYSLGAGRKAIETPVTVGVESADTNFEPPIGLDMETKAHAVASMSPKIEAFFKGFETQMNQALAGNPEDRIDDIASSFSESFVQSSPLGVVCHQNDAKFRRQMSLGIEFYRNIGIKSLKSREVSVTPLDDFHSLATVRWQASCVKKDGTNVELNFNVIYFLQLIESQPKIFAAIAGDEQKSYIKHGLLPE